MMKAFKIFTIMLGIMMFVSTYAFASRWMPEKYDLDHQLTKVPQISNTNFIGWEKVDNQSLVLQTTPGSYYLIVLSYPAFNLPFTERIGITGMNLLIRPGYDNVIVREATGRRGKYIINKIYKFKDREQVWQVIGQLTGTQTTVERQKKDATGESLLASMPVHFFNRF